MTTISTEPMPGTLDTSLLDRQALRFLLDHRLARLLTDDPATGEPHVTPVHYVPDGRGALATTLPSDSGHAAAIRAGGRTLLSVSTRGGRIPGALLDADGMPTEAAIWHVQADVEAELIEDFDAVREVLRRQIASVLDPLPQGDKSDPLSRAARTALRRLAVVRLEPVELRARLHEGLSQAMR